MNQIDDAATKPLVLERCYCPGTPHDHDEVHIRTEFGWGDVKAVRKMGLANPGLTWDEELADLTMMSRAVTSWTFVTSSGEPVPISLATLRLLPIEVGEAILNTANENFEASRLPNASGARSQPSIPASSGARTKTRSPKR
jgi:hypothetical protein